RHAAHPLEFRRSERGDRNGRTATARVPQRARRDPTPAAHVPDPQREAVTGAYRPRSPPLLRNAERQAVAELHPQAGASAFVEQHAAAPSTSGRLSFSTTNASHSLPSG